MSILTSTIIGSAGTFLVMISLYFIKRSISESDSKEEDIGDLKIRVSGAEQRLNNIDSEITRIEEKIDRLDGNQQEMREELSSRLSDLRDEQTATKRDVKWIKRHLEGEKNE